MLINSMTESKRSEKRYLPRWDAKKRVVCRQQDEAQSCEVFTKNISASGACLVSREELPLKKRFVLAIYLSEHATPIHAYGPVVWQFNKGNEIFAGIRFDWIDSEAQSTIFNYAFEYKRKDLVKQWFKGC